MSQKNDEALRPLLDSCRRRGSSCPVARRGHVGGGAGGGAAAVRRRDARLGGTPGLQAPPPLPVSQGEQALRAKSGPAGTGREHFVVHG